MGVGVVAPVPTLLGWFSSAPKLRGVATVDMATIRHESNLKTVLVPPSSNGFVESHMPKVYLRCVTQVIMYKKKMFET